MTFVPVTTDSGRLQHFAQESDLRPRLGVGRSGSALCASQIHTVVYDQAAFDEDRSRWSSAYSQKLITSLPMCKRCAKKAGAA
jgi:hypothetical protein